MRCAGLSSRSGLGEDRNHGGADVSQVRTWVGLNVLAAKVVAAIANQKSGELVVHQATFAVLTTARSFSSSTL
jgi:hypothetical protein